MAVAVGQKAPAFTLPAANGMRVSLADFSGQTVVLYFYPKDDTPGCTREACAFRDAHGALVGKRAVVIGVSPDPLESHRKFRSRYELPFLLLSDTDHRVASAYGVWVTKTRNGEPREGIERSTFVIGPDGVVQAVFHQVKVEGHVDEVLGAIPG